MASAPTSPYYSQSRNPPRRMPRVTGAGRYGQRGASDGCQPVSMRRVVFRNPRRTGVLLTAVAAALAMTGGTVAAAAEPGQDARRVLDLSAAGTARTAADGGSTFTGVSPVRVMDTRSGLGVPFAGPVPAGGTVTVDLSSRVPEGTTAVVLNLTGVAPTSSTYVTVWPAERARPTVSNLNLAANETRANAVTVALGPGRALTMYNNSGRVDLAADLAGYYSPTGEAWYNSHSPQRVLDTRDGTGPIGTGGTITVDTSRLLPFSGAVGVTLNVTVVNPTADTYLTAFPTGTTRPVVSSVNATRGRVTANQVTLRLHPDKDVQLYNHTGSAHVTVDMVGWYDTSSFEGSVFHPVDPTRVLDTRTDGDGPLRGGVAYSFVVTEDEEAPEARITAMVLNVTGTGGTASTYLTLYPSDGPRPVVSAVNLAAGQTASNLATTALGWGEDDIGPYYGFSVYHNSGDLHVLLDWAGYFTPAAA